MSVLLQIHAVHDATHDAPHFDVPPASGEVLELLGRGAVGQSATLSSGVQPGSQVLAVVRFCCMAPVRRAGEGGIRQLMHFWKKEIVGTN